MFSDIEAQIYATFIYGQMCLKLPFRVSNIIVCDIHLYSVHINANILNNTCMVNLRGPVW